MRRQTVAAYPGKKEKTKKAQQKQETGFGGLGKLNICRIFQLLKGGCVVQIGHWNQSERKTISAKLREAGGNCNIFGAPLRYFL